MVDKNKKKVHIDGDATKKVWRPKIPEIQYEEEPLDLSYMETDTEYDPITYSAALGDGMNLTYGNIPEEVKEANANGTVYTPDPEPEVPTYEQWLTGIKEEAIRKARAERERAISDAEYSYARYLNPYGAHAESMSSAGLGNTGYSDYLKGNAYTTMREEIGKANAAYADAEREADLSYAENLYKANSGNLPSYIANAESGQYTSDQVEQIISQYGYTGADADALRGAVKQYEQGQNLNIADISSKIANSEFGSWAALESYAKAANLDPEQFKSQYASKLSDDISYTIRYSGATSITNAMLDELKSISPEQYEKVMKQIETTVGSDEKAFLNIDGTMMSGVDAKAHLAEIDKNSHIPQATKDAIRKAYEENYTIEKLEGDFKVESLQINTTRDDNFFIVYDGVTVDGGDRIKLEVGGEATAINQFPDVVQNLETPAVFKYKGKYYVKQGGFAREIQKRNDNQSNDWDEFIRLMNTKSKVKD